MKLRGRRVALLLASAFPLLADDVISGTTSTTTLDHNHNQNRKVATSITSGQPDIEQHPTKTLVGNGNNEDNEDNDKYDDDNNDDCNEHEHVVPLSAVESIHEDGFRLPSLKHNQQQVQQRDAQESQHRPSSLQNDDSDDVDDTSESPKPVGGVNDVDTLQDENSDRQQQQEFFYEKEKIVNEQISNNEGNIDNNNDSKLQANQNNSTQSQGPERITSTSSKTDGSQNQENESLDGTKSVASSTTTTIDSSEQNMDARIKSDDDNDDDQSTKVDVDRKEDDDKKTIQDATEKSQPKKQQQQQRQTVDEDEESLQDRVRVDYASKSAGALVIEKSSNFKGTSNLLNGDRDKYAIAACEEKKFVVISLSEDILVKEIRLANYERFSSTIKEFQILGSQTLGKWVDLGTYLAKPGNGEQKFELAEPAWARYLKFKFLTHHGVEYYCTYSQIKVHGSTMVQGFHEQWEDDDDDDDEEQEDDKQGEVVDSEHDEDVISGGTKSGDSSTTSNVVNGIENNDVETREDENVVVQAEDSNQDATKNKKNVAVSGDGSVDAKAKRNDDKVADGTVQVDTSCDQETGDKQCINKSTSDDYENGADDDQLPSSSVGEFHSSPDLDNLLQGKKNDGDATIFTEIYELIPSTLNTLPTKSRDTLEKIVNSTTKTTINNKDDEKNKNNNNKDGGPSLHQLGTMALQFLHTSTKTATGEDDHQGQPIIVETVQQQQQQQNSGTKIAAPRMDDETEEYTRQYLGGSGGGKNAIASRLNKKDDDDAVAAATKKTSSATSSHDAATASTNDSKQSNKDASTNGDGSPTKTAAASTSTSSIETSSETMTAKKTTADSSSTSTTEHNMQSSDGSTAAATAAATATATTTNKVVASSTSRTDKDESKDSDVVSKDGSDHTSASASSWGNEDITLAKLLESLPSADCLLQLDFGEFKKSKKVTTPKKSLSGGGTSQSSGAMEPIFKKLTDEIKSLQTSLSVQEQYNKMSSSCYQRVLLDLITETERIRTKQGDRLTRLEEQFQKSQSSVLAKLSRHVARAVVQLSKWLVIVVRTICEWSISYLYYISSMIAVWILSLFELYIILPRILLGAAIPWWPKIKSTILATASGSNFVERVLPMIVKIDRLMEEQSAMDLDLDNIMTGADGTDDDGGGGVRGGEIMGQRGWIFPVLPLVLCLCLIRIIMCFSPATEPSPQTTPEVETKEGKAVATTDTKKSTTPTNSNGISSNSSSTPSTVSTATKSSNNRNTRGSPSRPKRRNPRRSRSGRKNKRSIHVQMDDDDDDHDDDHHLAIPDLIDTDVRPSPTNRKKKSNKQ